MRRALLAGLAAITAGVACGEQATVLSRIDGARDCEYLNEVVTERLESLAAGPATDAAVAEAMQVMEAFQRRERELGC